MATCATYSEVTYNIRNSLYPVLPSEDGATARLWEGSPGARFAAPGGGRGSVAAH